MSRTKHVTRHAESNGAAVNGEGLTYSEWCAAALAFGVPRIAKESAYRAAWRAGEDPTEWCAAASSSRLSTRRAA